MFVPRQVQKKPTPPKQPTSKSSAPPPPPPPLLVPPKRTVAELSVGGGADIVAAREIVMALEILLSDYSFGKAYGSWLGERMREFEGKDDYIHLSALVDCQYLSRIRPRPSQVSLMKALTVYKSDILGLSADKYHVRRKTKFLSYRNENQDDFTIYIEPNITGIILNPGKIARILSETQLPRKYFPVQFVDNTEKPWSFVTLSSAISEADVANKKLWPEDWIILTKSEWRRRDVEYQELRQNLLGAPTSYHRNLQHKFMQDVYSQSENADPRGRRAAGPNDIVSLGETLSHRGNSGDPTFESRLIVCLTNLHPSTTKATINSFVCRSVGQYLRKKEKKQGEKKDDIVPDDNSRSVKIHYVDYEKGLGQAYIRQSDQGDSELVVQALQKRKRKMRDGKDIRGMKVTKADEQDWVMGKVLIGEEERIYWEKLLSAKNGKGKGKRKNGRQEGKPATSDLGTGTKRIRQGSENSGSQFPKRIRFDQ